MNEQINVKRVTGKTFNSVYWPDFIADLVARNCANPKQVLKEIISVGLVPDLKDESIFTHRLKEFLIKELRKIYSIPVFTHDHYGIIRKIKCCNYHIENDVTDLIAILPESNLSIVTE